MSKTAQFPRDARSVGAGFAALTALLVVLAGCSGVNSQGRPSTTSTLPRPKGPVTVRANTEVPALEVVSVTPAPGSTSASFAPEVRVRLSEPLARNTAMPSLSPPSSGTWTTGRSTFVFHPLGNFVPSTTVKLTLPGGVSGLLGENGAILPRTLTIHFAIRAGSELRLQQLLAELGYLPLRFVPGGSAAKLTSEVRLLHAPAHSSTTSSTSTTTTTVAKGTTTTTTVAKSTTTTTVAKSTTTTTVAKSTTTTTTGVPVTTSPGTASTVASTAPDPTPVQEPDVASDIPLTPLQGSFSWRFPNIPPSLSALWAPGQPNVITTGAIMQFEDDHGLDTDGVAGPEVWSVLLQAVAHRQLNTAPYDYVWVTTDIPETLYLWSDGNLISPPGGPGGGGFTYVNTGIPEAPTQLGTWPVYARYVTTTMSGYNPDGSYYSDPGIPWVSYFHGGDALHGFLRAGYGYPQSLGCVEMTYAAAGILWPYTPIGTLVTIE